ncbi:MAG: hypothetical protein H0V13_04290 [Nocardioidaceae bacterium]|jgi:Flp pilus assembly protein TadG|nr:hypothetical protein [Nocardioidaceae bacterium]
MRPGHQNRVECGSFTPFVAIIAATLLLLAGLVIDGSRQLATAARAVAVAEEAARSSVQQIDPTQGLVTLVPDRAEKAVVDYCEEAKSVDDDVVSCELVDIEPVTQDATIASVTVEAVVKYDPILLDMVTGDSGVEVTESATAFPVEGIDEAILGELPSLEPVVDESLVNPGIGTAPPPDVPTAFPTCQDIPPGLIPDPPGGGQDPPVLPDPPEGELPYCPLPPPDPEPQPDPDPDPTEPTSDPTEPENPDNSGGNG